MLSGFDAAEAFFLLADTVGDGFEGGAQMADFGGESGEGASVVAVVSVVFDDGAELDLSLSCPHLVGV